MNMIDIHSRCPYVYISPDVNDTTYLLHTYLRMYVFIDVPVVQYIITFLLLYETILSYRPTNRVDAYA